jgi:hypothetical protein
MLIKNPTLGAGNGKIGSLVGWAQGNSQVLRKNTVPKPATNSTAIAAKLRMKIATSSWKRLTQEARDNFNAYAKNNGFYSGWLMYSQGFTRALMCNYDENTCWSERTKNQVTTGDELTQFVDWNPNLLPVDWTLKTPFDVMVAPDLGDIFAYASTYGGGFTISCHFGFIPSTSVVPSLTSSTTDFGLMLEVSITAGKKKSKRTISVCSKFTFGVPTPGTDVSWTDNFQKAFALFSPIVVMPGMRYNAKLYLVASQQYFQRQLLKETTGRLMSV